MAWNSVETLTGTHIEFLSQLGDLVDEELEKRLAVLLHLALDRLLLEQAVPALELAQLLRGGGLGV